MRDGVCNRAKERKNEREKKRNRKIEFSITGLACTREREYIAVTVRPPILECFVCLAFGKAMLREKLYWQRRMYVAALKLASAVRKLHFSPVISLRIETNVIFFWISLHFLSFFSFTFSAFHFCYFFLFVLRFQSHIQEKYVQKS